MSNFHLRVKVWIPDHIFNTVRQAGVAVEAYSGYKTNEKKYAVVLPQKPKEKQGNVTIHILE